MTPAHTIQRIREATDLPALIAEYVPLKKRGGRLLACCPFHKEDTPSFGVHGQFFKCFGCGAGGDCFKFLQLIEGITFHDVVKRLAERAGIALDSRPINRLGSKVAMQYAREEAAMCRWWWERCRAGIMAGGVAELNSENADREWLGVLYNLRVAIDVMTPGERFKMFRETVTDREREEWRAEVGYERWFTAAWLGLSEHVGSEHATKYAD